MSIIDAIVKENLAVYRASPSRLREDASQEAQIANDYRGRLLYELLQNADDAMVDGAGDDMIIFRLTDTDLWVGNSGRPLDDADVRGLCGIGASSKSSAGSRRRASIGHKGMGFKSILEVTERPTVYSESIAFELSAESSEPRIRAALGHTEPMPGQVPIMRLPNSVPSDAVEWKELAARGFRTLFRFPLKHSLDSERRELLAQRLLELPPTAILFLKHLGRVEIELDTSTASERISWRLTRQRVDQDSESTAGLVASGVYRVSLEGDDGTMSFLLAHDADVEIGVHRGGLDEHGWGSIELSEVSVACAVDGFTPLELDDDLRRFHVFLPTEEPCPYPLLVNGAFMTDLSRQKVRVGDESDDYNRFLMQRVAVLLAERLFPTLESQGASWRDIVTILERPSAPDVPPQTRAGEALWAAFVSELGDYPLLPSARDGGRLTPNSAAVPPLLDRAEIGPRLRELLPGDIRIHELECPAVDACSTEVARVAADLGARVVSPLELPALLGEHDHLLSVGLEQRSDAAVSVDPVLSVLQAVWEELSLDERLLFSEEVRKHRLFPVSVTDGVVLRVATEDVECFYPPRSLKGSIPLGNLCFLLQDVCWGKLQLTERHDALHDEFVAWQGLFSIREFKFPDVMRASVLPSLALDAPADPKLQHPDALAAICQLSGRIPNPKTPLRFERLGSNRALFNLCRLTLPCRALDGQDLGWHPAYKVYFGKDWIGNDSIELVLEAMRAAGHKPPEEILFLQAPHHFKELLERFEHLDDVASEEEAESDEVELDEDEDEAYDAGKDNGRWLAFLEWLGVNRALRLVHFHDAEDQKTWLSTKELARPEGWAFSNVSIDFWNDYVSGVQAQLPDEGVPYFVQLHDFDHAATLLRAAAADEDCHVARALYAHLSSNWDVLSRFTTTEVAVVASNVAPGRRQNPPRPRDDELQAAGANFWLFRLRHAEWCPTTHGPRRPLDSWIRTAEVDRRFGRQGSDPRQLLPLLDHEGSSDRGLSAVLGVRAELTPAAYRPTDAIALLRRLEHVYGQEASSGSLDRRGLRVIQPAYRNLIELLPGGESPEWPRDVLAEEPLLTHDGHGQYRFGSAKSVFHVDRPGTRERLGSPHGLWSFVLEGARGARGPLTTLLGATIMEDAVKWSLAAQEPRFDGKSDEEFRTGLRLLGPFFAARLAADRQDEALVSSDRRTLTSFIDNVVPVASLELRCRVGDVDLGLVDSRGAFVDATTAPVTAFVVWDESPWPPTPEDAGSLATALADLLHPGFFEAFLALVTATSDGARRKLLRLAGAPNPEDLVDLGTEPEPPETNAGEDSLVRTPGEVTGELPAIEPRTPEPVVVTPLYRIEDLAIDQDSRLVHGVIGIPTDTASSSSGKANGSGSGVYGGRTDLSELDQLGMAVAIGFERHRLGQGDDGLVFDVSSKHAIDAARQSSQRFVVALDWLTSKGLNPLSPGFDVLTLDPSGGPAPQRLIELKSSGVNARMQEMSWNEWKSARQSELRTRYYLYLVGNLRSDLGGALPFLRAVRDPFGSIFAEEKVDEAQTRRIRIDTMGFTTADEVELTVNRQPELAEAVPVVAGDVAVTP